MDHGAISINQNWKEYSSFGQMIFVDSWRLGVDNSSPNIVSTKMYLKTIQYLVSLFSDIPLNLESNPAQRDGASLGFGFLIRRVASTIQLTVEAEVPVLQTINSL